MSTAIFSAPAPAVFFGGACSARFPVNASPPADRPSCPRPAGPHAIVRAVRRGDHSCAAGIRRHAVTARAECGAGAACCCFVALRIIRLPTDRHESTASSLGEFFPGGGDGPAAINRAGADRTGRRGRHRALAAAMASWTTTRGAAGAVRARLPEHHDLVAGKVRTCRGERKP